ncbi:hypothetical protein [Actinacidiphila alni]|uniref:hypothetical protein n=1 Tax=Actinacidiphila alni TaxID=380248 RepID=UPI00345618EA
MPERAARLRTTAGTALTVAALTCAMSLATQLPAVAAGCAHPKIKVLDRPASQPYGNGAVFALGRGTISAGSSGGLPVYWIGKDPVRVPFPAGYTTGAVNAINKHGLMAGYVRSTATGIDVAFSYRIGAAKAKILPGGSYAADVNDHGDIVGGNVMVNPYTAYIWHGGTVKRQLTVPARYELIAVSGINNDGTVVGDGAYDQPGASNQAIVGLVWPGDPAQPAFHLLPVDNSPDTGVTIIPEDIDNNGRIVGQKQDYNISAAYETFWDAPYTAPGAQLAGLPGYHDEGYFYGSSPSSGLVAGEAPDILHGDNPVGTAQIWAGSGPIRALPRLAPNGRSAAYAAADNGNVGGSAADANGTAQPVIWTCAVRQAL